MDARAATTAAPRARILSAGQSLAFDDLVLEPTLRQVAAAAGTTEQTVLRHFGSRAELLVQIERSATAVIVAERTPQVAGDEAALDALLGHYERRGDFVLAVIARAATDRRAAQIAERGRQEHRAWLTAAFAERLPGPPAMRD